MADDELNPTDFDHMEQQVNQALLEEDEPGQSEASQSRITEFEGLLAQREEEISLAKVRVSELEQAVTTLEGEVAAVKQSNLESDQKMAEAGDALSRAVDSYKALVIDSNPVVTPELITGDTIEAINDSLKSAKDLISRVKGEIEAEIKMARIPAGAPQRTPPDLSALSSREKIQYAIGGNK